MNTKRMLDQILAAGQDLAVQGKGLARKAEDFVAERAGAGDDPQSRETLKRGAVGGALAAGVLGLLLGTRGGRAVGGAALRVGSLAALGTLAYNAYKKYAGSELQQDKAEAIEQLDPQSAETRAQALLSAMIAAAKADGHIDEHEREIIETRMKGLGDAGAEIVAAALQTPTDPKVVAAMVESDQARRETYAISCLVARGDAPEERRYLDDLAQALGLESGMARAIEDELKGAA